MPSVSSRVSELKHKFYDYAPKKNQPKIEKVLETHRDKANVSLSVAQNMVMALYSPSFLGGRRLSKCVRTS